MHAVPLSWLLHCSSGLYHSFLSAHDVPSTESHLSPKSSATHAARSVWLQEAPVEVSVLPLTQSPGQEPHQAGLAVSYCCVGFCLPSLPVCGHPTQLAHHHATVHLPRSLKAESFNPARTPYSERMIITLMRKKWALQHVRGFRGPVKIGGHILTSSSIPTFCLSFSSQKHMILFYFSFALDSSLFACITTCVSIHHSQPSSPRSTASLHLSLPLHSLLVCLWARVSAGGFHATLPFPKQTPALTPPVPSDVDAPYWERQKRRTVFRVKGS